VIEWLPLKMTALENHSIQRAAAAIDAADALLISAGAGMGVDSGLPDFRGDQGFWKAYPMIAQLGLSFSEMANPSWFSRDPQLAWAFYGHRLHLYRATPPHAGFAQLLAWGRKKANGYFVFTSNVDGQFQKAGFDADRMVECHGSIHHFQCATTCSEVIWDAAAESVTVEESSFRAAPPLPRCRQCGGMARPNVMMFNDGTWIARRSADQSQRFDEWIKMLEKKSARLAVVELGAGTAIPSVRRTSEALARQLHGSLVRLNSREPEVPPDQIGLAVGAAAGLDQLAEALAKMSPQ
jgi:NAD-dependent SIR2 family protein deacetylase